MGDEERGGAAEPMRPELLSRRMIAFELEQIVDAACPRDRPPTAVHLLHEPLGVFPLSPVLRCLEGPAKRVAARTVVGEHRPLQPVRKQHGVGR